MLGVWKKIFEYELSILNSSFTPKSSDFIYKTEASLSVVRVAGLG